MRQGRAGPSKSVILQSQLAIDSKMRQIPDGIRVYGGQYFATHAEKKLIAYFIDRHVFMLRDREPNQELEDSILEVEDSLEEGEHSSVPWAKVCELEERKVRLDHQLFDTDDRLLGDLYNEQEVKRLKHEIHDR